MVHDKVTIDNLHEVIYMVNLSHVTLSCNSCNMKMCVIYVIKLLDKVTC